MRLVLFTIMLMISAQSLSQTVAQQWRTPKLENQVYMMTDEGLVIIELAPFMAPQHIRQFSKLVSDNYYDGQNFYRVIDGFVAQAGNNDENRQPEYVQPLKAEFERIAPKDSPFKLVQDKDFIAPQTGFLHGFAAGRDNQNHREWLLHCPGTIAMARGTEKDSASSHFYIVIGQAPRHLDRNMSSFGRVIYGMPSIQRLKRAHINNRAGVIENIEQQSKILWMKFAKDVPPQQRLPVQVQNEFSEAVSTRMSTAKELSNSFFHFKGNGNLDICYYQLKSRIRPE